jgi:hypothetical protein
MSCKFMFLYIAGICMESAEEDKNSRAAADV